MASCFSTDQNKLKSLVFEELYNSGKSPDDVDGEEIVDLASFYNYIPPDLVEAYAEALLKEYGKFCKDKKFTTA